MNERIKEHDLHIKLSPIQTSAILEHPFYDHVSCLDCVFSSLIESQVFVQVPQINFCMLKLCILALDISLFK